MDLDFPGDQPAGYRLQMAIWGYAVSGDTGDLTALIGEGYPIGVDSVWDGTARDLTRCSRFHDGVAVPAVSDWLILHEDLLGEALGVPA